MEKRIFCGLQSDGKKKVGIVIRGVRLKLPKRTKGQRLNPTGDQKKRELGTNTEKKKMNVSLQMQKGRKYLTKRKQTAWEKRGSGQGIYAHTITPGGKWVGRVWS